MYFLLTIILLACGFPLFNRYSCLPQPGYLYVFKVFHCSVLILFLINLLKQNALFRLVLIGVNVSCTFFPLFHKQNPSYWRFPVMEGDPGQSYPWMLHSSHADCACLLDCGKFVILNHRGLNAQIDKIKTKSNSMRISKKTKQNKTFMTQWKLATFFFFLCHFIALYKVACLNTICLDDPKLRLP